MAEVLLEDGDGAGAEVGAGALAVVGLELDWAEGDGSVRDPYRIAYMRAHVEAMAEAIEDGVELIAYTPWGITDLVAASTGEMAKRYGVIYVDADDTGNGTYDRYRKDSFYWYQSCIVSAGTEL